MLKPLVTCMYAGILSNQLGPIRNLFPGFASKPFLCPCPLHSRRRPQHQREAEAGSFGFGFVILGSGGRQESQWSWVKHQGDTLQLNCRVQQVLHLKGGDNCQVNGSVEITAVYQSKFLSNCRSTNFTARLWGCQSQAWRVNETTRRLLYSILRCPSSFLETLKAATDDCAWKDSG